MSLSHNRGVRDSLTQQRDRYRIPPTAQDARNFMDLLENPEAVHKPREPHPPESATDSQENKP